MKLNTKLSKMKHFKLLILSFFLLNNYQYLHAQHIFAPDGLRLAGSFGNSAWYNVHGMGTFVI